MSALNQSPALIMRVVLGAASGTQLESQPEGLVTTPGQNGAWPAFVAVLPDGDDVKQNVVALFDREGVKHGRLMSGEVVERYNVQILLRSPSYRDGFVKMREVAAHLDAVSRLGIDVGNYLYFIPNIVRGTVIPMGQDPNSKKPRFLFSLNTSFVCNQEGPYEEWGNENGELYTEIYNLHKLVHVDFHTWFPA